MSRTSQSPEPGVLVVGAGPTAHEHLTALRALGIPPDRIVLVGRSRERVERLAARHGVAARSGGLDPARDANGVDAAIVAIREDECAAAAGTLVEAGVRSVLIEKPGALEAEQLRELADRARAAGANVFVAYNRRFYPSVTRARELVQEDGGALSCFFDFTEVERLVLDAGKRRGLPPPVLARWGVVNSLHVIDLAFELAGRPQKWTSDRAGALDWHPSGAVFHGSGATVRGAAIAYLATWSGVGRWGVEVTTAHRKLVLRPLEELRQQVPGGFALESVQLQPDPEGTKPGFVAQVRAFLVAASGGAADARLCTALEAAELVEIASVIFGYGRPRTT